MDQTAQQQPSGNSPVQEPTVVVPPTVPAQDPLSTSPTPADPVPSASVPTSPPPADFSSFPIQSATPPPAPADTSPMQTIVQPETKSSHTLFFVAIVLIVLIAGVAFFLLKMMAPSTPQPQTPVVAVNPTPVAQNTPIPTPTDPSLTNTSNDQLTKDGQNIDASLNQIDAQLKNVDAGLNDKAINVN